MIPNAMPPFDFGLGETADALRDQVQRFASDQVAPIGVNWSFYKNPEVDQLVVELKSTFDPSKQDEITARIHAKAVDDAVMIWVYHDTTARALSPKIKKYVQAQSWFQDLALLEM